MDGYFSWNDQICPWLSVTLPLRPTRQKKNTAYKDDRGQDRLMDGQWGGTRPVRRQVRGVRG